MPVASYFNSKSRVDMNQLYFILENKADICRNVPVGIMSSLKITSDDRSNLNMTSKTLCMKRLRVINITKKRATEHFASQD